MQMMMFTTNPACSTVLHHLVADSVDMLGGSRDLIRLLNRLGVCVACDTHDRLVTDVAEQQRTASIWSELSPSVFTVTSVDNIDFLQSHAAVYCGDQSCRYHGTMIQVVQPIPSLKLQPMSTSETTTNAQPNILPDMRGDIRSIGIATPSTEVLNECRTGQPVALVEPSVSVSLCKCRSSSSPGNSPHKHGKIGPKQRTIKVTP